MPVKRPARRQRIPSQKIVNGRARRSYGLTEASRDALRAEAARMERAAGVVARRARRSRDGAAVPAVRPA